MEAAEEAKAAKRTFGSRPNTNKGAMIPDRSVYFDDFARKQASPTRTNPAAANQAPTQVSNFTRPTTGGGGAGGACEWDRLMREREELL